MMTSRISAALLLAAGLFFALPARAADAFLRLEGIDGESTDARHTGWIEVSSFQLDQLRRSSEIGSATGGAGAGKVTFHDISFTKKVDKASPKLFQACAAGKHYPSVTLAVRKAGGGQQEFLVVKMENVFISSFSLGGGGGGTPQETMVLNFSSAAFENLNPTPRPGVLAPAPAGSVKR